MNHDTFAAFRAMLLLVLILALIGCCIVEAAPTDEPEEIIATIREPEPTTAPTINLQKTSEETPMEETEPATIATEPPSEPTETEPPYNEEELEMLALAIYQEAGADTCSDETRLMVGTVVMNRIAANGFPDTMYDVLTQRRQYGRLHWTGLVWPDRAQKPDEAHAVKRAYEIAERILLGERAFPADVVWQAEFVQGTEVVAYQDGLYFCR